MREAWVTGTATRSSTKAVSWTRRQGSNLRLARSKPAVLPTELLRGLRQGSASSSSGAEMRRAGGDGAIVRGAVLRHRRRRERTRSLPCAIAAGPRLAEARACRCRASS